MSFCISPAKFPKADDLDFELVERKGIGHPDTLCDAIAERASRYYSQYFLKHYGKLAHHWVDKVMLLGGQSIIEYGRGEIVTPYKVIFAGKAVTQVGSKQVPIEEIFYRSAADVLSETLDGFHPSNHLEIKLELSSYVGPGQKKSRYNPESENDLFDPVKGKRVSNDCNVCSGYAPFSTVEKIVSTVEAYLVSLSYREKFRDTGFDVKVVGIRRDKEISLFVNIPFLAARILSYEQYIARVEEVKKDVEAFVSTWHDLSVKVVINPEKDSGRSYLTVTGSVADTGDIGVVGRGNRINGLITPMRPMSIEAASGKNPIDHTGKIYGILSQEIAEEIYEATGLENQVHLVTFKEYPVEQPESTFIYIHGQLETSTQEQISRIAKNSLAKVASLTDRMINDGIKMW